MKYSPSDRLIIYIALLWELENLIIYEISWMCGILEYKVLSRKTNIRECFPELYKQKPKTNLVVWWTNNQVAPRITAVKEAIKLVEKKIPNR